MIWSLIKGILILTASTFLALGASQLMEIPGGVTFVFDDKEIRISLISSASFLLSFAVFVFLLFKILGLLLAVLGFLTGQETAVSRYFKKSRELKGNIAIKNAVLALTEGDNKRALTETNRAQKSLGKTELAILLSAQAASSSANSQLAENYYKELLMYKDSKLVALLGLIKLKIADGKNKTALKLAKKAAFLKPKNIEVIQTLFKLQTATEDWSGARKTLISENNIGKISVDIMSRREGVLLFAEAINLREAGDIENALVKAREAIRKSPSLVPAVCMASELEFVSGRKSIASKLIKSCWNIKPHPNLAKVYAALETSETPLEKFKRFGVLFKNSKKCFTNNVIRAELYIGMEDFPAARRELKDLITGKPNSKVLILMAAIEKGSGASEKIIRGWLTRAASAERESVWFCDSCGNMGVWEPICTNCYAFDTYDWGNPFSKAQQTGSNEKLLPLIVGDTGQELDLGLSLDEKRMSEKIINLGEKVDVENLSGR